MERIASASRPSWRVAHGDWVKDRLTIAPIWREDMLKYVSMDVTNSMCLVDQIMQIFLRQIEAIVCNNPSNIFAARRAEHFRTALCEDRPLSEGDVCSLVNVPSRSFFCNNSKLLSHHLSINCLSYWTQDLKI